MNGIFISGCGLAALYRTGAFVVDVSDPPLHGVCLRTMEQQC
jgi:hypothetical protein